MSRSAQTILVPAESAKIAAAAHIFAGTSGWAYPTWKPAFYPEGLPQKRFLEFYATQLTSVEVNYTFRAFPTPAMIANWLSAVPDYFRFSFKAPQRITHIRRLASCDSDLAYFVSVLEAVRQAGRLGLLLFQLPPNMKADATKLRSFLELPALSSPGAPPIAFEFRHETWFAEEIYSILREHNAALCVAESDGLVTPEVHTATTHTSFRLRRSGAYSPAEIADFAARFAKLAASRDTYIYFKHEDEPTGALNATSFLAEIEKVVRS